MRFIEQSAAQARSGEQEERDRRERERLGAIERARAAEREVQQTRMRILLIGIVAIVLVALCVATLYFYLRARDEARRADAAAAVAETLRTRAEAQLSIATGVSETPAASAAAPPTSPPPPANARMLLMDDLARIMPDSTAAVRAAFLRRLNEGMVEFAINTPLRQAHFLGQMAYESGDLMGVQEKWTAAQYQLRYEPPSSLAKSLGNIEPGDGERYRGRGLIWIVGRGSYNKYGEALGLDLVGQPDLAARPDVAVRTAGLYWKLTRLNDLADADDLRGITRRINEPRMTGWARREAKVNAAKAVLGVDAAGRSQ